LEQAQNMAGPVNRKAAESTRDAARTREEILRIASEVFAADGFAGARVDEIAARMRTTKRMIYYYFGSKEQLYIQILERAYAVIRLGEQDLDFGQLAPIDGIRKLAEFTYDHHVNHPEFVRLVSIENIHRAEYMVRSEKLRELNMPVIALIEDMLSRGRADGSFHTDMDATDVHMLISSYCVYQVANRYTFRTLFGRDLLAEDLRDHHRAIIGNVVVATLTAGSAVESTGRQL
jgi:AcrR family transcriptional regulator